MAGAPLLLALWADHFNCRADEFPETPLSAVASIKKLYLSGNWASAYDFVEFVAATQYTSVRGGPDHGGRKAQWALMDAIRSRERRASSSALIREGNGVAGQAPDGVLVFAFQAVVSSG